jgi:hypothetical protein
MKAVRILLLILWLGMKEVWTEVKETDHDDHEDAECNILGLDI